MAQSTSIEWCDHTFNIVWGCTKVSEACRFCYAAEWAARFGVGWGPNAPRQLQTDKYWAQPLAWDEAARKAGVRRRVFCSSMADVFEDHPTVEAERARLWRLILQTPHLDWLLLTKRPEVMARWLDENVYGPAEYSDWTMTGIGGGVVPNVWLGVSVENQARADERIPHLLATPASVRFLSMEPLLGPVDLNRIVSTDGTWDEDVRCSALTGASWTSPRQKKPQYYPEILDWIIVGGESGRDRDIRWTHLDWVRSLRDQATAAKVPFFFKQWGAWVPDGQHLPWLKDALGMKGAHKWERIDRDGRAVTYEDGLHDESDLIVRRLGKKRSGRLLDGRTWDEMPQSAGVSI